MTPAPVRLVHLITDLDAGGAEGMLARLAAPLRDRGFEQTIVSLKSGGTHAPALREQGFEVYELGWKTLAGSIAGFFRLASLLKRLRPDILQTWLYHADLAGTLAAKASAIPIVCWNIRRSGPAPEDPSWVRPAARLNAALSRAVDAIIVNSRAGLEAHAQLGYPRERLRVIPNGFDCERYRPAADRAALRRELGVPDQAFVIGAAGRWQAIKGWNIFFDAACRFSAKHPEAFFVIAGRGLCAENPAVNSRLREGGIAQRCVLLGERADLARLYSAMDCFTSASLNEGFPNVVAEAMACGVPAVASRVGETAEIIGETGELIEPGDSTVLLAAWERCLNRPQAERESRGRKARQRILDRYALATVAEDYAALYRSLITHE